MPTTAPISTHVATDSSKEQVSMPTGAWSAARHPPLQTPCAGPGLERRMVGKGRAGGGVACGRGIGAVLVLLRVGPGLRADPEQPACASMPCRLPRASRGRVRNQPPEAAQGRGDTVRQARRPIRSHRADRRDQ
jgi:hypothetical protein